MATRAGPIALQTYDVLNLLFEAIAQARGSIGRGADRLTPDRLHGSGAKYAFDQRGRLIEPRTYVLEYDKDRQPHFDPVGSRP